MFSRERRRSSASILLICNNTLFLFSIWFRVKSSLGEWWWNYWDKNWKDSCNVLNKPQHNKKKPVKTAGISSSWIKFSSVSNRQSSSLWPGGVSNSHSQDKNVRSKRRRRRLNQIGEKSSSECGCLSPHIHSTELTTISFHSAIIFSCGEQFINWVALHFHCKPNTLSDGRYHDIWITQKR